MTSILSISESKFLERVRTALTNAKNNVEIKTALADYGTDDAKVTEGETLYNSTKVVWEQNKQEDSELSLASKKYKDAYSELQAIFKKHREITLKYFRNQPEHLIVLGIKGRFPTKYNEFFDKTKQYYTEIQNNTEIQDKLTIIKITPDVVTDCLAKHTALLADRAHFEEELGESQDATKSKNAALLELKEWMEEFDTMAEIALYDKPQLLEALGIFVKS